MEIVLYYAPIACSLVPYVTLTEANAKFEVRTVNLRKQQQNTPEYLKLNPKHKVPVLVVDGRTLTENVAINTWVARTFPDAKLLPTDPWQQLQATSLMSWCASGIHPFLTRINSPVKVSDAADSEDSVRRLAREHLVENYKIADAMLAGREYFFQHFTAADAHFYWAYRRGTQLVPDLPTFPKCSAHFERMQGRPSVQKVLAFEKSVQAEFTKAA